MSFEHTCGQELPPEVDILLNGRRRVTRRFTLGKNGNIDDVIFRVYGEDDPATITSCTTGYANLKLVAQKVQPSQNPLNASTLIQVFETLTDQFVGEIDPVTDFEMNGLKRVRMTLIAEAGTDTSDFEVGVQELLGDVTLYLAAVKIEEHDAYVRVLADYLEPGIVEATVLQEDGGLLLVTFKSFYTKTIPSALNPSYDLTDLPNLAFQGGADAELFRNRVENVLGYKVFTVTSMMNSDGSALDLEADNVLHSYQSWMQYEKPGELDVSSAAGPRAFPGNTRWVLALVEEILTTLETSDESFKPFSVTNWAFYYVSYTPSDGSAPVVVSKGASGYLADSTFAGTNTTYADVEVDVVAAAASSTPTPEAFYALVNPIIGSNASPAFVTDGGVKWYRKQRVTVVGTFGSHLN